MEISKTEQYQYLLEDLQSALQETDGILRHTVISNNYEIGRVVHELCTQMPTTEVIRALKTDLKRSEKSLYDYKKFFEIVKEDYHNELERFLVNCEYSTSWNRIRKHVLSDTPVDEQKKADPFVRGERAVQREIKKNGLPSAKEYVSGASNAITDAQDLSESD